MDSSTRFLNIWPSSLTKRAFKIAGRAIEDRHDLRNKPAFELLSDVLSSDIGSLTNLTKIENTLKSSHYKLTNDTIVTYISYLTDAFLFEECKRFDIKGKSHISSPLKYYCGDIGLWNARLHFNEQEYQN